jgi:RHH-type proline utilization regulon transcriptional repressor/proline dehydrogenase/delta 1-pyrroline-5-carboxylate dehydrogenase
MCLAEALLRVPDKKTADKLIRDKIVPADWQDHIDSDNDLWLNFSALSLKFTGRVLSHPHAQDQGNQSGNIIDRLIGRLGQPVIRKAVRQAMKIMGRQFVLGQTIDTALKRGQKMGSQDIRYSFDMLGEGARTADDAKAYYTSYERAITKIGNFHSNSDKITDFDIADAPGISIKLSALHPRYQASQADICLDLMVERVSALANHARLNGVSVTIDAEEADRLELSLQIFQRVLADPGLESWDGFGLAVQAYQTRCHDVIDHIIDLAKKYDRRIPVRLVKGAYWDTEIKHAQELGLKNYPVFTRKSSTDLCFLTGAAKMLANRNHLYPQLATHNAHSLMAVLAMAGDGPDKDTIDKGFEIQRLHGMGRELHNRILRDYAPNLISRVYAPVGRHEDLLPYLVRRLLENGANSSFVHSLFDPDTPVDELIQNPHKKLQSMDSIAHPNIPLQADIYGDRNNSRGLNIQYDHHWHQIDQALQNGPPSVTVDATNPDALDDMIRRAGDAFDKWNNTPANRRAQLLDKLADAMEDCDIYGDLLFLLMTEGKKTADDAIAEIREAIDFCRYYANQGRRLFAGTTDLGGVTGEMNTYHHTGRGVFVCISPWNFPCAIFLGQIMAAAMAGNTVIAKPAEQTPKIARYILNLIHDIGFPADAIQLAIGGGPTIGASLVNRPEIAGVAFTGSTTTAKQIHQTLADQSGPIGQLIAETGGQNVMIADTTALTEQLVDDVVTSAFRSAGQRCSACRILCLPDETADDVIDMLTGAMDELVVGDPTNRATDVGPVIDRDAYDRLKNHLENLDVDGIDPIAQSPIAGDDPLLFPPTLVEIPSLDYLRDEHFGPICHVYLYDPDDLDQLIDDINDLGYGLTLGVHSRIDTTIDHIIKRARVGNIYINRSMIGAVVGVQPFGGMNLSGTGPKAGGPDYLPAFGYEKSVSRDTTAAGGNASLINRAGDV